MQFPPFRPRFPWFGGDLQTLRTTLVRDFPSLRQWPETRLRLPLDDGSGDRLVATLHEPGTGRSLPLVILIHGLTGCEGSAYILSAARGLLRAGFPVMRLNLRGAGPSAGECRERYHAGRSDDLRRALAALPSRYTAAGVLAVGFSLGGNTLLKYLGEEGEATVLAGAAVVSTPIDLAACTDRFQEPRNILYHRWMLARLKSDILDGGASVTTSERNAARAAGSMREFDDAYTGPHHGFADAADFYARCSATRFIAGIRRPTLVIQARDDPWIPIGAYDRYPWAENEAITTLFADGGGHIGFHGHGDTEPWHVRSLVRYFSALAGLPAVQRRARGCAAR